jgi:hypothetical protein
MKKKKQTSNEVDIEMSKLKCNLDELFNKKIVGDGDNEIKRELKRKEQENLKSEVDARLK